MNFKKLAGLALASSILLSSGAAIVSADEIKEKETAISSTADGNKTTTTNIEITDDNTDKPDPIDPTDPTNPITPDPGQEHLLLQHVPEAYNFSTQIKNKKYILTTGKVEKPSIEVFNDRSTRNWRVKASLGKDVLERTVENGGEATFPIDSFSITTGTHAVDFGTGKEATVFENLTNDLSNTGTVSTDVKNIGISFNDSDNKLKAGQLITGTISYQLYLVTNV
ncbi:hypothetical protein OZX60_05575 [Streptococcaceae bacterium ESL0687]|nr:hypothetical protein OZX60_05575 [Streptococcaceae bacterium ESL0687]